MSLFSNTVCLKDLYRFGAVHSVANPVHSQQQQELLRRGTSRPRTASCLYSSSLCSLVAGQARSPAVRSAAAAGNDSRPCAPRQHRRRTAVI